MDRQRSTAEKEHSKAFVDKMTATDATAAAMPHNANKHTEYDVVSATVPPTGQWSKPAHPSVTASTVTASLAPPNAKVDTGISKKPQPGQQQIVGLNMNIGPLVEHAVDSTGQPMTTNTGMRIADNQHSLRAGVSGPTLLEDFVLREKITHFDHERIPERVVHARGFGAHGTFECYESLSDITRADFLSAPNKVTPVFVRFSTVLGSRGSADTVRDVRGFAVKFYTDEGNFDLVGNNIPIFFIQDAIKFPDVVHAAKPEPHFEMPQASTAHDSFWDFVSLSPESVAMQLWIMSDRAIPRSYRTMAGFGVHTFQFINAAGQCKLVKFHWVPLAGTHSLVWDEAVKLAGADVDFHRRDLWESIESGAAPKWELAVQIFDAEMAQNWDFDVLDSTKLIPEELVPLRPIGVLTLNRNVDYFFGETEQVAFCASHIVPGIGFTDDPLLQGRLFSYLDTQLTRLGGPNFQQIPINLPVSQVHNGQRDGFHQNAIFRGRVANEPNSLAGGCPFQAGARGGGYVTFPGVVKTSRQTHADETDGNTKKLRVHPAKFAEHYSQATLFWNSQTPVEKRHIIDAFVFELTHVQSLAVRRRVLAGLRNVTDELARPVADKLGLELPQPLPKTDSGAQKTAAAHKSESRALSLMARPGDGSLLPRVAILVADGVNGAFATAVADRVAQMGGISRFVGVKLGHVAGAGNFAGNLTANVTLAATPSVLYDAVVLPDSQVSHRALARDGRFAEFVREQYRHCKTILCPGEQAFALLSRILANVMDGEDAAAAEARLAGDPGIVRGALEAATLERFAAALARGKHYEREMDPPRV